MHIISSNPLNLPQYQSTMTILPYHTLPIKAMVFAYNKDETVFSLPRLSYDYILNCTGGMFYAGEISRTVSV